MMAVTLPNTTACINATEETETKQDKLFKAVLKMQRLEYCGFLVLALVFGVVPTSNQHGAYGEDLLRVCVG